MIVWLSADDDFLRIHSAFGYAIGVLILFRIVWSILGPKYSLLKDLNFDMKKAIVFSKNVFTSEEKHLGHNPAASIIMTLIVIITLLISVTGILALGEQEAKGLFSSLSTTFLKDLELFEELHELIANLLLVLIVMHLAGIFMDKLIHSKDETLKSIITGYKNITGESVKLTLVQKIIAAIFAIATVLIIILTFSGLSILY